MLEIYNKKIDFFRFTENIGGLLFMDILVVASCGNNEFYNDAVIVDSDWIPLLTIKFRSSVIISTINKI